MENEEIDEKENFSDKMLLENVLLLTKTNCNQAPMTYLKIRRLECTI